MVRVKKFKLLFLVLIVLGLSVTSAALPSVSQADNGGWSTPQEVTEKIAVGLAEPASIAVDPDGQWHIVYREGGDYSTSYIKYMNKTSGPYVIAEETAPPMGYGGVGGPSIAIDSNGGLHVTYNHVQGSSPSPESVMYMYKIAKCDFSTEPNIERCFGGIGTQCQGDVLYFYKDENTCLVEGWMSVGSILHDRCCIETNNTGFMCANPRTLKCFKAFNMAVSDVSCGRFWDTTFGPYPAGNTGDDTSQALKAPAGARVSPKHENYCSTGKCKTNEKGKTVIGWDDCGRYCECQ